VDSSVTAALLHHAGYQVIGISMQLFDKKNGGGSDSKCCTLDDFQDARRVAHELGFAHYVMDFEAEFRETVIEGFIQGYLDGETPSPCIRCNQYLKFSALMERAESLSAPFLATGHYAAITQSEGTWHLRKASDPVKDQSYFLFHHNQATLPRTLFPLAQLSKPKVRKSASWFMIVMISFWSQRDAIQAEARGPSAIWMVGFSGAIRVTGDIPWASDAVWAWPMVSRSM
jgi:tRNA-specific 2-thiouridylase